MGKVKDYLGILIGGWMTIEGEGRTFVKVPVWLSVLAAFSSVRLAVLTALLVVAFGMKVRVAKA